MTSSGSERDAEPPGAAATPGSPPDETIWRALAQRPGRGGAIAEALRTDVLRRQGDGHIAGVCAALAHAGGLPVRLVRIVAVGLLGLGIGLPIYLVLALTLPRERRIGDAPDEVVVVDVPARALLQGRPGRGDVLVALGVLPSLVAAYSWIVLFIAQDRAPLRILVPVVAVLLTVLAWGALRARRARSAYLFAELGHRAGILDDEELRRTLEDLRAYAPRAWYGDGAERAARPGGALRPAGPRVPRTPRAARLSPRHALALVAGLLVIGTCAFTLVSLVPSVAPGLGSARPLPGIGRVGAAAAVVSVSAGLLLVGIGLLRRRSIAVALAGLLAITTFAGSVVWVRMTDSSNTTPMVVEVERYTPGAVVGCTESDDPGSWDRDVVIDLSRLSAPGDQASVRRLWEQQNPGAEASTAKLGMTVRCDRLVGDVRVILPAAGNGLMVDSGLTTTLGEVGGPEPPVAVPWTALSVGVTVRGHLGAGDITFEEAR